MSAGIYIDDSGTPGVLSPSAFLHSERKSWAAVIVPEDAAEDVGTALSIFLAGIASDYGASELHFTDIFSGRGPFRGVVIDERYRLIDLMASIFEKFQLPIFFQTSSPEFLSEVQPKLRQRLGPIAKTKMFDLRRHDHLSLFFLLFQVERFLLEYKQHFKGLLPVVVDEGIAKAGVVVELSGWAHCFRGGLIEFRRSHECPFLQLGDSAAFAIARAQWLLARGDPRPRDVEFLRMISPERLCMMNLSTVSTMPDTHTTAAYDVFLRLDRIAKGLPADPALVVKKHHSDPRF